MGTGKRGEERDRKDRVFKFQSAFLLFQYPLPPSVVLIVAIE